ncbi:MAG: heme exporter protein CcmD [Proteobacteria bacterium]|uniref:heme exporter protein CcmD n=1 Tax=Rudaea sp. TaxID=2136325 RepID=UPI00321FA766|nr:heme exporter protein CcmD [Pseudomonadota bacterium]
MAEFFHMGGYGAYVWAAYAVFVVVLLADALAPLWQRRGTLRDIAARLRRESKRKTTP